MTSPKIKKVLRKLDAVIKRIDALLESDYSDENKQPPYVS